MTNRRDWQSRTAGIIAVWILASTLLVALIGCQASPRRSQEVGATTDAMDRQASIQAGDSTARSITNQNVVWARVSTCA